MRYIVRLLIALLVCAIIGIIAWGILQIAAMLPIPDPVPGIIDILVKVVAVVACLITLIEAFTGWPGRTGIPWPS